MRFRGRHILLSGIASSVAIFSWTWGCSRPPPTLAEVCRLAQAGRFAEARARGRDLLREQPNDSQALLVMAELALAPQSPDPQQALGLLERIHVDSPALRAWVLIDQGNAFDQLGRPDRSAACWRQALRVDPGAQEAARRLFDLLTLQGRRREARALGLSRLERQSDALDQARWLLRLARLDVDPPDPRIVIERFEGTIQANTADLPTRLAHGLALTIVGRRQDGLAMLREAAERHPRDANAWDALLTGLDVALEEIELDAWVARLPTELRADPRFAKHLGRVEQHAGRWSNAAAAYRRAWEFEPDNMVGYRLRRALAFAGDATEAARFDQIVLDYRDAFKRVLGLLDSVEAPLQGGQIPSADLALGMAMLRERMGRRDDGRAWRALGLGQAQIKGVRSRPAATRTRPGRPL
jgi:tetratricopeptide (TPR) repeat protein